VKLGPKEGGDALASVGRVSVMEAVVFPEVVGDGEEVVASLPVEHGELFRATEAFGIAGVSVEVTLVEAPRFVEGKGIHESVRYRPSMPVSRSEVPTLANP
jgi:hypothetical protein